MRAPITNVLNLQLFCKTLLAIVLLIVTALALPSAAQTQTTSEIDALKTQLAEAQDVFSALGARVQCYVVDDARLQADSSQLQQTAGDLHRQEQTLSSELAQSRHEAEAFRRDFEATRQETNSLEREMSKIQAKIRVRQAALDNCKSKAWIFGFVCDWAGELAGLNGDLRKLSSEIKAVGIKASSLQKQLSVAEVRQNQAAERLQITQVKSDQIKGDIVAVEAEIKVIKASLSYIRTVKQDYFSELGTFQDAYAKFVGLAPGSDRRSSVVRRLRRKSADLDDLRDKARVLLEENSLQLLNGERTCAN